jgi:hypothetical protein
MDGFVDAARLEKLLVCTLRVCLFLDHDAHGLQLRVFICLDSLPSPHGPLKQASTRL